MTLTSSTTPTSYGRGTLQVCRRGQRESIVLTALHRPRSLNAFNEDMYLDLLDLLQDTIKDDSVDAIVLTGTGRYFSTGADVKDFSSMDMTEPRRTLERPVGRFMMALIAYPKVIAAAVQGPAVGIAVTLLLHCDIVHCSERATLWAPFTRLALVPELCSSVTFRECMGLAKANEMLLLGRKITAHEALAYNICSRVVAATGDDFPSSSSVAENLCQVLDQNLLSLPLGGRTGQYFVDLMRGGRRKEYLQDVCRAELVQLDERFDSGQALEAASQLMIGSQKKKSKTHRARL